jgi:hypothetical protein
MARKTIKREVIIERLNAALRSEETTVEQKEAIATFAEMVLIRGNSYEGYTIPEPGAEVEKRIYM